MIDVGDAVELTFSTTAGATVTAEVYAPDGTLTPAAAVSEEPAASGLYPFTLVPLSAGPWRVIFRAAGTVTAVEQYDLTARAIPASSLYASVDDVADVFPGELTSFDRLRIAVWLRHAGTLIRGRWPDIDTRISAGTMDPGRVELAATQMVLRVLKNPRGYRQQSVGGWSATYDTAISSGALYLSDEDARSLAPPKARRRPAGSISIVPGLSPSNIGRPW